MSCVSDRPWSTPLIHISWKVACAATDAMSEDAKASEKSMVEYSLVLHAKTGREWCSRVLEAKSLGDEAFMHRSGPVLDASPSPR